MSPGNLKKIIRIINGCRLWWWGKTRRSRNKLIQYKTHILIMKTIKWIPNMTADKIINYVGLSKMLFDCNGICIKLKLEKLNIVKEIIIIAHTCFDSDFFLSISISMSMFLHLYKVTLCTYYFLNVMWMLLTNSCLFSANSLFDCSLYSSHLIFCDCHFLYNVCKRRKQYLLIINFTNIFSYNYYTLLSNNFI